MSDKMNQERKIKGSVMKCLFSWATCSNIWANSRLMLEEITSSAVFVDLVQM